MQSLPPTLEGAPGHSQPSEDAADSPSGQEGALLQPQQEPYLEMRSRITFLVEQGLWACCCSMDPHSSWWALDSRFFLP